MARKTPRTENLERHLAADYPVQLHRESDGDEKYWVAEVPDLPGCVADGEAQAEALTALVEAKRLWIETAMAEGRPIPAPTDLEDFSGRVLLRIPKSLHRELSQRAGIEGTSLNQLLVMILSRRVDYQVPVMKLASGKLERVPVVRAG